MAPTPAPRSGRRQDLAFAFVLEGDLDLGTVGLNLAVLEHHVLLHDLGDAQIA